MVEVTTLAIDMISTAVSRIKETGAEEPIVHDIINRISEQNGESFFVTPKETDHIIKDTAKLIGYGLNLALHKDLSFEDIDEFLS